ncbi:MAG TPA: hypothetical protein VEX40_11805 [Mycobacterium sp.]|nr:hypothetical protein [Mycobacterium sp.]
MTPHPFRGRRPGWRLTAIGARRIAPLWRILDGVAETDWTDAIDMSNAQVAVAEYCPDWWPAATRLLIRRVRLDVSTEPGAGQVSADPRARRRRTLHPNQRALPIDELAAADAVYGYSFIVTLCRDSGYAEATPAWTRLSWSGRLHCPAARHNYSCSRKARSASGGR